MPNSTQVTLKQLRYFRRIVERKSISGASEDLNIAQTALGLQVRALEEALGVTLLVRHPKGVDPTTEGKLIYQAACQVLSAIDAMVTTVANDARTRARDIWLGLPPNLINAIGARAVVEQAVRIPDATLHISDGSRSDLLEEVRSGKLDWAIVHNANEVEGCRTVPIIRHSLMLICRPGSGFRPGPVKLKDALACDLVLDSARRVISGVVGKATQALNLVPNVKYEVDSLNAIRQLILSEGVCGLLSRAVFQNDIDHGLLEEHLVIEPPLDITAYFVTRSQNRLVAADRPVLEFLDMLIDDYCDADPAIEVRLSRLAEMVDL